MDPHGEDMLKQFHAATWALKAVMSDLPVPKDAPSTSVNLECRISNLESKFEMITHAFEKTLLDSQTRECNRISTMQQDIKNMIDDRLNSRIAEVSDISLCPPPKYCLQEREPLLNAVEFERHLLVLKQLDSLEHQLEQLSDARSTTHQDISKIIDDKVNSRMTELVQKCSFSSVRDSLQYCMPLLSSVEELKGTVPEISDLIHAQGETLQLQKHGLLEQLDALQTSQLDTIPETEKHMKVLQLDDVFQKM
jgi:hypothetical protein